MTKSQISISTRYVQTDRGGFADAQGKVYVDPLVEEIVSTPQDVVDLLEKGNTQRKTGATDWVSHVPPRQTSSALSDLYRMNDPPDPTVSLQSSSSQSLEMDMEMMMSGFRG
jgi:hypothetical protein